MKKIVSAILILTFIFACDDDERIFEKSADQRVAEAIASLKDELTDPEDGWILKYKPVKETGSYYVLLQFRDDNKVTIRTDLGANEGEFQQQTIGYRIDSSLGLELIFENYSFFSYLFELDQASYGAEYELNYVNKTSDGALVFQSKTDISTPTTLLFQPAEGGDENLLGREVGVNLDVLGNDLDRFSSSLKITYQAKDLELYISMDAVKRVVSFNMASKKTNPAAKQTLNRTIPYYLEGNAIVLEESISTNISGNTETIQRIELDVLNEASLDVCDSGPFEVHTYSGSISNSPITLETTINDLAGAAFATEASLYFAPLSNIRRNRLPLVNEITADIAGALELDLYYDIELNDGTILNGIGFVIRNNDGSITLALREFTPVLNGNNIIFNFKPGFRLFGEPQTDANLDNINKYLDFLTEGDKTFVYKYAEGIYEFNNPCTGWSFVFLNGE